jgi:predicted small lipoprotein YifL
MKLLAAAALVVAVSVAGCGETGPTRTPSPPGAKVFFIEPKDGAEVTSPVTVKFGIEGMEVVPAGTEKDHSGHHHVLIDTKLEDANSPIPADDNHKHFGKAQTEATLELTPGKHTLQMVLGDHNHIPHDPVVQSEVITITVK